MTELLAKAGDDTTGQHGVYRKEHLALEGHRLAQHIGNLSHLSFF